MQPSIPTGKSLIRTMMWARVLHKCQNNYLSFLASLKEVLTTALHQERLVMLKYGLEQSQAWADSWTQQPQQLESTTPVVFPTLMILWPQYHTAALTGVPQSSLTLPPSSPHQGQEALLLSQAEHGTNYWDGFSASNLQPGTVWGRLSRFPPGWVCGKIRTNRITFFFNCNRKEKSKTSLCLKMLLINLF